MSNPKAIEPTEEHRRQAEAEVRDTAKAYIKQGDYEFGDLGAWHRAQRVENVAELLAYKEELGRCSKQLGYERMENFNLDKTIGPLNQRIAELEAQLAQKEGE